MSKPRTRSVRAVPLATDRGTVWIGQFRAAPRWWRTTLTRTGAQADFPTKAEALADARRVNAFAGMSAA